MVHVHPVDLLRDVDVVVSPSNTYFALPEAYKSSVPASLRRAGALRGPTGELVEDLVHDELSGWTARHGAPGRLEDGVALSQDTAQATDPAALAKVADLPLESGKVSDLTDHGIVVNQEWAKHTVGQTVDIWLGDGTRKSLRIVAVMRQGTGNNGVYVTSRNGAGAAVDRIDVRLRPGAAAATVAAALSSAVRSSGGQVLTKRQWVAASYPQTSRQTRIGFWLVLGIALLYTAIALANTLVMATSDRVRDLAVLRLAGATTLQVLRLVAAEALVVVVVGAVLAASSPG